MRLQIIQRHPRLRGLSVKQDSVVASMRFDLMHSSGLTSKWVPVGRIPASPFLRNAALLSPIARALRLRVFHFTALPSGTWLATTREGIMRCGEGEKQFGATHWFDTSGRPATHAFCVHPSGRVLYGDYLRRPHQSEPVCIRASDDDGRTFRMVHAFPPGRVRHIHFVQVDPETGHVWIGTGDKDGECLIAVSTNRGESFEIVGEGAQQWRAVCLAFKDDYIYWGTDSGRDQGPFAKNGIVRMHRTGGSVEWVHPLDGPVHGGGCTAEGHLLFATGVESHERRYDSFARLWGSPDGTTWTELGAWEKDRWPVSVQYGLVHVVHGQRSARDVWLNFAGLKGERGLVRARIMD